MAEITVDPNISSYNADKNVMVRYKRQEGGIWRKAGFLVARNGGKIRHWGQEGAQPNLLSLVCSTLLL